MSQGLWSSIIVIVSFTWGIFIFHEGVKSIVVATAAVALMIVGLWGMSFYSSPSFSQSRNYEQVRSISSLVDIVPPAERTGDNAGVGQNTADMHNNGTNGISIDHGDESHSSGLFSHVTNHISLSPTRTASRSVTRHHSDYEEVHSPFGSYDDHHHEIGNVGANNTISIPSDDEDISMEDSTTRNNNGGIYDYNQQHYDDSLSYTSSMTPTSETAGAAHHRKTKLKSRSSSPFSLSLSHSPHDYDTKATNTTINSTTHTDQHYLEERTSTSTDGCGQEDKDEDYFFEHPTLHSNNSTTASPSLQESQNQHRPMILSKRTLGLLSAIFNGVWGGSIMVPMHYAPPEAHGTGYVVSFAIGATIITICLWIGRFLYHYAYHKKSLRSSYDSLPPFHFCVMWKPGGTAGLLWSIGNLSSMISVQYLGEGVGYSLTQASMLVSGIWGIFYFREVEGIGVRVKWFVSALITISGILLLSFEHVDDGGDGSGSSGGGGV